MIKVVLLGVGGLQKDDATWLEAAAQKYPDRVIPGRPLPDPNSETAAQRLDADLARSRARVIGALRAQPKTTVILAHAGQATPNRIAGLLTRNPNLLVDLSGMHFQRTPSLASEHGPLDPAWKALIERMSNRFLMGIDVWAPRLFEPAMLDAVSEKGRSDVMRPDAVDGSSPRTWWHAPWFYAGLLSLLGALCTPQGALAHAVLLESTPRATDAVSEVRRLDLRFNSRLEPAFSQVRLTWPSGDDAPLQVGFSRAEPNRLTTSLPTLQPDLYTVHWRVLTVDGHLTHGSFSFQISPPRP